MKRALERFETGGGSVTPMTGGWRLAIPATTRLAYADAQLQDYTHLARLNCSCQASERPSMRIQARFSHLPAEMGGTFGFGWWNNPISLTGGSVLAMPHTAWWFGASRPNDLRFTANASGADWGAGTLAGARLPSVFMLAGAASAVLLTRIPVLRRFIVSTAQRLLKASQCPTPAHFDPREWHEYTCEWQATQVKFWLDGELFFETGVSPTQALGWVAWVDNQYAVLSPQGALQFGLVACAYTRWMEIRVL
ncbi:MAG TPA: hypothetical protein PK299_04360 [Anaerolineales bacterium]|nr:hypothetical protein [Anaerolineales bacterium]